jgi:hypothetical protein
MTIIRSVRIFSAAKVNALLYGILGLLAAPFLLLGPGMELVGGSRPSGFGATIVVAVFLPLCYAIFGFIAGALMAFLYNAISRAIGGIEVELATPLTASPIVPAPVIINTAPADVLPPLPESPPPKPSEFE